MNEPMVTKFAGSRLFKNSSLFMFSSLSAKFVTVLFAVIVLANGCIKVGPDFLKPSAPLPTDWIEKDPKIKREVADDTHWWAVFNDPVLNSVVETAYKQNLPLRIAGIRIFEARARLGIAVGSQYPQLQQGNGDISAHQVSDHAANASAVDKFFYGIRAGFDVAREVDLWGRFRRGVESADASLRASVADYDDVLVSLVAEAAATYSLIRTFQARLEFARQNVRIQTRSLQIADARFRGGAVTELDVAQARSLLRDTESWIPELEIGLRQAQNALSVLLGTPPRDLQEIWGR
jgi:outer membrane protein TolC